MTNYFLLYTPFHAAYAQRIIREHFISSENLLINHYSAKPVKQVENSATKVVNLAGGLLAKIKTLRQVRKQLQTDAKSLKPMNVLIPHTLGLLSNFVYFRLARKYPNVNVNIYYEGVIVFYNYDHSYYENLVYYSSRWLLGLLCGIKYHINKRLLDFYDKRVSRIFTPFRQIDAPEEKIIIVPLGAVSYVPEENTCVVIGLVMTKKYNQELPLIIDGIYRQVKALGLRTIYFKDHPLDHCDLYYTRAVAAGLELIRIQDTSPVEEIIGKYKPKYILSSWSSASLNIRSMIANDIKIYCFVTERITETPESKRLVEVFGKEGIEVVYV